MSFLLESLTSVRDTVWWSWKRDQTPNAWPRHVRVCVLCAYVDLPALLCVIMLDRRVSCRLIVAAVVRLSVFPVPLNCHCHVMHVSPGSAQRPCDKLIAYQMQMMASLPSACKYNGLNYKHWLKGQSSCRGLWHWERRCWVGGDGGSFGLTLFVICYSGSQDGKSQCLMPKQNVEY